MNDDRILELRSLLPQCLTRDWVRLGARLVRFLRDQHHSSRHDELLDRLLIQARQSAEFRELRRQHVPRCTYSPALPITARREDIVETIRKNPVVVIAGETGSGKTTQIPKMCLEAGLGIEGMIGCTQPRRVAALSISRRIAEELNVSWGREVGCKIRFDDRSGPETYLKLMTDGILLAETQGDPLLADYNCLIIDEAHERSLNIDFLLGYLKGLLEKRKDLKLIITSATIDTAAFSRAFNDAPVIEVSGRTFPVEVIYAPPALGADEGGEVPYVEAAVTQAEQVLRESSSGDLLVFLPGERDIREAADDLEGRCGRLAEIIPLYGRLSSGDQQRVFQECDRRKVVIATNIAETSLTIPGIRFVIDAGMARISRYNPRTRTKRLPIEPVSQSSANQRKGRAGRVEAGVCIRLFSEEDFEGRPAHTQPEIQRANLAEVILRMKAFRLGDIETFPFLNPPAPSAITGGYNLLRELGALDAGHELTPLGRDLARLPIDPTLGRMVLQARQEQVTHELLVIASGLSIQDPRERPSDQQGSADSAHRRHAHTTSDFLSLLNLWNFIEAEWNSLRTQGQRRKFCKANFLSYLRVREWQDLQTQLEGALRDLVEESMAPLPSPSANTGADSDLRLGGKSYDAIHRSILAGLLGHVAQAEERNQYKAAGNRPVMIFPGSALFVRHEKGGSPAPDRKSKPLKRPAGGQPAWIVAGEIVETSQLFARTVAAIDPAWIPDLAPHLVKTTHQNPRWVASAGQVVIDEIVHLYGLEVRRRRVAFGNLDPKAATQLFIRSALVEGELLPNSQNQEEADDDSASPRARTPKTAVDASRSTVIPPQYRFLDHNRRIREKIEAWQTRVRHRTFDADQALADFYGSRLEAVSSVSELNRWLQTSGGADRLCCQESDLTAGRDLSYDAQAFPESVALGGQPVALQYAYAPGEEHDGVTVKVPFALVDSVAPAILDWAIPGLRAGLVEEWLRALPKAARRQLQPIPPKVENIVQNLHPQGPTLGHDLARFVRQHYGLQIEAEEVSMTDLPQHLRPRVEVVGPDLKLLASGRDWNQVKGGLPVQRPVQPTESNHWKIAAQRWEKFSLTGWTVGDLPDRIEVATTVLGPQYAWPGFELEDGQVHLRLFASRDSAQRANQKGIGRLLELSLHKELAWLQKDLKAINRFALLYAPLGSVEVLQESAFEHARRYILDFDPLPQWTRAAFDAAVQKSRSRLTGLVPPLLDRIGLVLELRNQIVQRLGPIPTQAKPKAAKDFGGLDALFSTAKTSTPASKVVSPWMRELESLLPERFLENIPFGRLAEYPRYLKALLLRMERASQNPPKDQERQRQLDPFVNALKTLTKPSDTPDRRKAIEEFRWMIEEFKVSLFAQELGTAIPVSTKRLNEQLSSIQIL